MRKWIQNKLSLHMNMKSSLHQIVITIGTRGCGKTRWCLNLLESYEKSHQFFHRVSYINFEKERFKLMGTKILTYGDQRLKNLDTITKRVILSQVQTLITFPMNMYLVVIDGTHLGDADYLNKLFDIAKENHYKVTVVYFNYKNDRAYIDANRPDLKMDELLPLIYKDKNIVHTEEQIREDIKWMHNELHKIIGRGRCNNIIKIKNIDQALSTNCSFRFTEMKMLKTYFLPNILNYFVIGDCHEHIDQLKELLIKAEFTIDDNGIIDGDKNSAIVFIGDFIDKGLRTKEMIEFIYDNVLIRIKDGSNLIPIYFVEGNHENFVNRYLTGDPNTVDKIDLAEKYFTSIKTFQSDPELMVKFILIYKQCRSFYLISAPIGDIYLSHAPCENKFLGSITKVGLKEQRYFFFDHDHKDISTEKVLKLMSQDNYHYYHIFGHVTFSEVCFMGNYIGIDTGCGSKGRLSGLWVNPSNANEFKVIHVDGEIKQEDNPDLIVI